MYKIRIIILLLFNVCVVEAQYNGIDMLNKKDFQIIPFKQIHGFVILEVKYGPFPLNFIFDTGAKNLIFFDKLVAQLLPIKYEREIGLTGADFSSAITAKVASGINLKLGDITAKNLEVLVLNEDLINIEEYIGEPVHGILGSDLVRNLIVKIDYDKSQLVLYNPSKIKSNVYKNFSKIPSLFNKGKIYIDAEISNEKYDSVAIKLLVDSGASISSLLHNNTNEKIIIPEKYITGSLGRGLSGEVLGFIGKLKNLSIGDYGFSNVITYYQDYNVEQNEYNKSIGRNGILGNFLLERFTLLINYPKSEFYLKPNSLYKKKIEFDKSGLVLIADGKDLKDIRVSDVIANSPAEKAGIKAGDRIMRMGWSNVKDLNLDKISKKLCGKIGKEIKLKIVRDGKTMKIKFKLNDLFETSSNQIVPNKG